MNGQERIDERRRRQAGRRGFTLIELLVVILIILLVSAVVLPTVLPAISHRQVSEAARILQGALVGARDTAINNNAPAGIRLLPDPVLNGINPATDWSARWTPTRDPGLQPVHPDPARAGLLGGACQCGSGTSCTLSTSPIPTRRTSSTRRPRALRSDDLLSRGNQRDALPRAVGLSDPTAPTCSTRRPPGTGTSGLATRSSSTTRESGTPSSARCTSTTPSCSSTSAIPGRRLPLLRTLATARLTTRSSSSSSTAWTTTRTATWTTAGTASTTMETGSSTKSSASSVTIHWRSGSRSRPGRARSLNVERDHQNIPYTITRRPVVSPGSRETPLPSNVVVDLTTWNADSVSAHGYVSERSRLPVDPTTGYVDILLNPNGTVVPTTEYSSPSSFGMNSAFYHFWLAERGDLFDPVATPGAFPTCCRWCPERLSVPIPTPTIALRQPVRLKGERRLITLFTRTGQHHHQPGRDVRRRANREPGPNLPFLAPQQGIRGDTR